MPRHTVGWLMGIVGMLLMLQAALLAVTRNNTPTLKLYFLTADVNGRVVWRSVDGSVQQTVGRAPDRVWLAEIHPHNDGVMFFGTSVGYAPSLYRMELATGRLEPILGFGGAMSTLVITADGIYWCELDDDSVSDAFPSGTVTLWRMPLDGDASMKQALGTVRRGEAGCGGGPAFYGVDGDFYVGLHDFTVDDAGATMNQSYLVNARTGERVVLDDDRAIIDTLAADPAPLRRYAGWIQGPLQPGEYRVQLPGARYVITADADQLDLPPRYQRPDQTTFEIDGYITSYWQDQRRLWVTLANDDAPPIREERLVSYTLDGQFEREWFVGRLLNYVGSAQIFNDYNAIIVHDRSAGQLLISDVDRVEWRYLTDCQWELCEVRRIGDFWVVSRRYFTSEAYQHTVIDITHDQRYLLEDLRFLHATVVDLAVHPLWLAVAGAVLAVLGTFVVRPTFGR